MTAVATTASTRVTPMALTCSIQRPPPRYEARLVLRLALTSAVAKKPVSRAPMVPPTPWTPKVSRASSYLRAALSLVQARKGTAPASTPMMTALEGATKPAPGVMTTRPATAPEQKPSTEGLPRVTHSSSGQTAAATAVARVVVVKALAATPSEATALPALKPYQPTQSIPVPTIVNVRLCGKKARLPKPVRLPRIRHSTRADQPEDMWT